MKRELSAPDAKPIPAPKYQKGHEREFAAMAEKMIDMISTRFKNQAIKGMDATTIDKFADAQIGNYAKIFLGLSKKITKKMRRQWSDDRIEEFTSEILKKTDKANRLGLYRMVENRIGIPAKELMATEGLSSTINALELETAQWMKRLRDETLEYYTANTLRVMAQGGSLTDVLAEYKGMTEKRKNHAKFTARNQIANFNSLATKARAQNLGISKAIWVTANDERVRPCHQVRNGKEFDLSEGLYSSCDDKHLLPGIDFNCRCTSQLILPE